MHSHWPTGFVCACVTILSYTCRSTIINELKYPLGVMMGFVLQDGWTALCAASQNGHLEIVKSLIEAGANVNHSSKVVENKT